MRILKWVWLLIRLPLVLLRGWLHSIFYLVRSGRGSLFFAPLFALLIGYLPVSVFAEVPKRYCNDSGTICASTPDEACIAVFQSQYSHVHPESCGGNTSYFINPEASAHNPNLDSTSYLCESRGRFKTPVCNSDGSFRNWSSWGGNFSVYPDLDFTCPAPGTPYAGAPVSTGPIGSGFTDENGCKVSPVFKWAEPTFCENTTGCYIMNGYVYGDSPDKPPKWCYDAAGKRIGQVSANVSCPASGNGSGDDGGDSGGDTGGDSGDNTGEGDQSGDGDTSGDGDSSGDGDKDGEGDKDGTGGDGTSSGGTSGGGTSSGGSGDGDSEGDGDKEGDKDGDGTGGGTTSGPPGGSGEGSGDGEGSGEGEGDGDGEGECDPSKEECGEKSSAEGGDSCDTPPTCEGDPLQCFQIKQNWQQMCGTNESILAACDQEFTCTGSPIDCYLARSQRDQYCEARDETALQEALQKAFDHGVLEPAETDEWGQLSGLDGGELKVNEHFNLGTLWSDSGPAGSCPAPLKTTVADVPLEFSLEPFCQFASMIRALVVFAAVWISGSMVSQTLAGTRYTH